MWKVSSVGESVAVSYFFMIEKEQIQIVGSCYNNLNVHTITYLNSIGSYKQTTLLPFCLEPYFIWI